MRTDTPFRRLVKNVEHAFEELSELLDIIPTLEDPLSVSNELNRRKYSASVALDALYLDKDLFKPVSDLGNGLSHSHLVFTPSGTHSSVCRCRSCFQMTSSAGHNSSPSVGAQPCACVCGDSHPTEGDTPAPVNPDASHDGGTA